MNIVGTKVKPIIFVKVEVQPEKSLANIMVERVELDGSKAVRSAGGSFNGANVQSFKCAVIIFVCSCSRQQVKRWRLLYR